MRNKSASATSIIGGADEPTTIFLVGENKNKLTLKQKIQHMSNKARKRRVMKSLKADAHTMDQVCEYIINELGYEEMDKLDLRYQEEYRQTRASLLLELRQEAAEGISRDMFDIDLHIYVMNDKKFESSIIIEKKYEYICGSASGSKREMKRYNRNFRKVYRYFGVTQKDIDEHTKRYEDVVSTLSFR